MLIYRRYCANMDFGRDMVTWNSGVGLFLILGYWPKICFKTQKEPAKCVYCVRCTLFPPVAEIYARLPESLRQMIWFGWMSYISQLASKGGGERGSWALGNRSPYRYTTWLRERAGRGVAFPPLASNTYLLLSSGYAILFSHKGQINFFYRWIFWYTFNYFIQHCIIHRRSDSAVSGGCWDWTQNCSYFDTGSIFTKK
jgi:hypothetical protein